MYYKSSFFFLHESDLKVAVGNCSLHSNSPANKNAPFHNARVSHVRATPPSKRAFSMRHVGFGRQMRSHNRRARSNRRARAESRKTSGVSGRKRLGNKPKNDLTMHAKRTRLPRTYYDTMHDVKSLQHRRASREEEVLPIFPSPLPAWEDCRKHVKSSIED